MAEFESLIEPGDLKMSRLSAAGPRSLERPHAVRYHDPFDALIIFLIPPINATFVYYLDNYVGLLCDDETFEIVGFQIEAFQHRFLSENDGLSRVWKLTGENTGIENFGQLANTFRKMEPLIAREALEASRPALLGELGQQGADLLAVLV